MSKYQEYQEALDILRNIEQSHNLKKIGSSLTPESDLLQELVDEKLAKPTKKEIKKEWKELGYKWIEKMYVDSIALRKTVEEPWLKNDTHKVNYFITINVINKTYRAEKFEWFACKGKALTFQEHQLLTKTFKWLGWEVKDAN